MKTYLTFTFDLAQAKHILNLLETFPSEAPRRRKGLEKMFASRIHCAEMRRDAARAAKGGAS